MKNSGSARVITIGHRQGLPKSISVGYGVTVEQRGAKCWTVEYHSQSDPGSSGSLVLFGGNIEITGKSTRVNLGTMCVQKGTKREILHQTYHYLLH